MGRMSLGNTVEEKKATYEALTARAKKWGKFFAVIGVIFGLLVGAILISGSESAFLGVVVTLVMIAILPLFYYWYGQVLYYGYLVVKSFFTERNIGTADVAGAVGTSFLVSYVLGGKKAAKKLGIMWLVVLMIALTVGVYAGLYYYVKFRKEARTLGFLQDKNAASRAV